MEKAFHIEFEDGSNPYYHFPCPEAEHEKQLNRWRVAFDLELLKVDGNMEYYRARHRRIFNGHEGQDDP